MKKFAKIMLSIMFAFILVAPLVLIGCDLKKVSVSAEEVLKTAYQNLNSSSKVSYISNTFESSDHDIDIYIKDGENVFYGDSSWLEISDTSKYGVWHEAENKCYTIMEGGNQFYVSTLTEKNKDKVFNDYLLGFIRSWDYIITNSKDMAIKGNEAEYIVTYSLLHANYNSSQTWNYKCTIKNGYLTNVAITSDSAPGEEYTLTMRYGDDAQSIPTRPTYITYEEM